MCVEKDERATDNKVKTGVQNILGGMVLASIPGMALGLLAGWVILSNHSFQIRELERGIEKLNSWRSETESNRFRSSDGERLQTKIDRVDERLRNYENEVHGWIEIIKRNADIILDNQKKSHTHSKK
ncbi:MAG: hypothetical protein KDI07_05235 [Anaerolineae bacterium]|nr:hypothetical protein [Anaerolineae bacterium]